MIQGKGCKLQHLQALMWLMLTDVVLGDGLELGGFAGGTHSEMFLRAFCQGEQPRNCLGFLNFLGPPNFYATATSSQLQQPTWMDSSIPAFLIFFGHRPVPTLALCRACSLAMVRLWEEPIARHKVHSCALAALGISLFSMTHLEDSSGRAVATFPNDVFFWDCTCAMVKSWITVYPQWWRMVIPSMMVTIALSHIPFFNHGTHE